MEQDLLWRSHLLTGGDELHAITGEEHQARPWEEAEAEVEAEAQHTLMMPLLAWMWVQCTYTQPSWQLYTLGYTLDNNNTIVCNRLRRLQRFEQLWRRMTPPQRLPPWARSAHRSGLPSSTAASMSYR